MRLRSLGMAVALAATLVTLPFQLPAAAADTLMSQGKSATASSSENGVGTSAPNAVDGDAGTRWSSEHSDPQWLMVDLGTNTAIHKVTLNWEAAYATSYKIQVSDTGTSGWRDLYSTTTGAGGNESLTVNGTGRYVRVYGTARATGYGYSLWEFQVYGAADSTGQSGTCSTGNAALNKPATASSSENGVGTSAPNAVDGDAGTRWSSEHSDPQWLTVDLGSAQTVCGVDLKWEAAYATSYKIQVSDTGTGGWTDLYSTTTGPGGNESLTVNGTGRYVRVYGTARATGYGYSLWEVAVHTGSGTPSEDWTTVWSDDFTGTAGSAPNTADWIVQTGKGGTTEAQTYTTDPANVKIDGAGNLALTALNSGTSWTSGKVETKRSDFAAPAGGQLRVTASLKQPKVTNGAGYWPAFRMIGAANRTGGTWPGVGEIDVMEDVNGRDQLGATLHCGPAPGGPCTEYDGITSGLASCPGCQDAYHDYSVIVDRSVSDEQIRWYLDGKQIWQVKESQVGVATWQAAVDHGFYLQMGLAVGGAYPDAIYGSSTPTGATSSGGTLGAAKVTVQTNTGAVPAPLSDPPVPTGATDVKVTGTTGNWALTVNGAPYQMKGVTWGPNSSTADAHMRDLKSMGVNTLRTWGTDATSKPLLDASAAYGIKVINGFWLNQGADYINDTAYMNSTLETIKSWVSTYKDHPGVLMWDVGNEVILTTQDHYSDPATIEAQRVAYAKYVERVVQAIHQIDSHHPVTSTEASQASLRSYWQYYKKYTPSLDLMAINAYGSICTIKQDWIDGGYNKPYIVTEAAEAGEWEVPDDANGVPLAPGDKVSSDGYTSALNCIYGNPGIGLGATMFNYGTENDFGGIWYNLIPGGYKRLSYYAVAKFYGGTPQANTPPVISDIALSNTTSVPAGGTFTLKTDVTDPDGDFLRYQLRYSSKYVNGQTPFSQVSSVQTGDGTFTVTAPKTLGVWKIYVYVHDGHGNIGVESRSFRVVPPPVNGTNVAKGKTTTASSYQPTGPNGPLPPSNATDGDWATRWASDWSDDQWIQVDLGQPTAFKHLQIGWESAYAKSYEIKLSDNGTDWSTPVSKIGATGGIDDFDLAATARYVRMNLKQRGTTYGYSLYELGIYN